MAVIEHSQIIPKEEVSQSKAFWPDSFRGPTLYDWKRQILESEEDTFILLDIDDTLVEGLIFWYNHFIKRPELVAKGITLEMLLDSGESWKMIKNVIGEDAYKKEEYFLKHLRSNYVDANLTDKELHKLLEFLAAEGRILGGLTARSTHPRIRRFTHHSMKKHNLLTDKKILYRPSALDFIAGLGWKPVEMKKLQRHAPRKMFVLVDDSASTAFDTGKMNLQDQELPPIIQILLQTDINYGEIKKKFGIPVADERYRETFILIKGKEEKIYLPPGVYLAENLGKVQERVQEAKAWFRIQLPEEDIAEVQTR